MDILCVDQRNADARVAVTQHIPSIFRAAKKTIVIRESIGFRDCCVEAAGRSRTFMGKSRVGRTPDDQSSDIDFSDGEDGRRKLRRHLRLEHKEEHFDDGVLSRLWPLQEIVLSDEVQFVRCEAVATDRLPKPFLKVNEPHDLVSSLSTLTVAWDTYGLDNDTNMWHRIGTGKWDFVHAYFHLGKVSRTCIRNKTAQTPRARDILLHLTSTRHTSKPRDFILAIMPQYAFYRVPKDARKMTFSELFLECCRQLRDHDVGIAPFLMDSENPLDGLIGHLTGKYQGRNFQTQFRPGATSDSALP